MVLEVSSSCSRRPRRGRLATTLLVGLTITAMAGCASASDPAAPPVSASGQPTTATAPSGDIATSIDIGGGRTMYLTCSGQGSPTVVLVSGLGERADNWAVTTDPNASGQAVYPQTARITRVCAYDRPGTETTTATGRQASRSTPVPQPITGTAAANDLSDMLDASGEPGPYLLVGHSFGGDIIRLYAAAHPTNVAGLVLVDALSEDLPTRLTAEQTANLENLNSPATQGRPAGSETFQYSVVFSELRASTTMPTVPTVVLSGDRIVISAADIASGQLPAFVDQAFADALWSAQLAAQDELAAKFPGATHITKTSAGHYIHLDNPQIVVDAIRQVISQAGRASPTS